MIVEKDDMITLDNLTDVGGAILSGPGVSVIVSDDAFAGTITISSDSEYEKKELLWAVFEIEQERRLAKEKTQ